MPSSRHPIEREFPKYSSKLHHMKRLDPAFAALLDEYEDTDKKIYGLARQQVPVSDAHIGQLKRHRLSLIDSIVEKLEEH